MATPEHTTNTAASIDTDADTNLADDGLGDDVTYVVTLDDPEEYERYLDAVTNQNDADSVVVQLESPFASPDSDTAQANLDYARACMRHSLLQGETPFASHLLYTQPGVLDDDDPTQRTLGINAGLALMARAADMVVVYTDRGISPGMQQGITRAENLHLPVVYRTLPDYQAPDVAGGEE